MPVPVAFLAENSSDGDFLYASARFRGYIDLGSSVGDELSDGTLEQALAWARARAPVVLIRLWDSDYFSAGDTNPDPDAYPEWPPPGVVVAPRRPRGLEALDNTEHDPPRLWDVWFGPGRGEDADRFRAAIEADARTVPVPREHLRDTGDHVRVLVRVSTLAQAQALALEIADRAHEAARSGVSLPHLTGVGIQVYPFAPDASIIFGGPSFSEPTHLA